MPITIGGSAPSGVPGDREFASADPGALDNVVSRIRQVAATHPDFPAIVHDESVLNYRELDQRSREVAQRLQGMGVTEGSVVGVLAERSVALVVAALGIMRAGGAYLPLDPSHPNERLAFQVSDSNANVVVTSEGTPADATHQLPAQTLVLRRDGSLAAPAPNELVLSDKEAGDLAYVIYTSGSTGRPKGVEISHANLTNMIDWFLSTLEVTTADRLSHVAAVGFDATVWELWPALAAGASIFVAVNATIREPRQLQSWLIKKAITVSFIPTPMAEKLIGMSWPSKAALRVMMTGGDTLHVYPPRDLPFRVVNNYGPTECTICATSAPVPAGHPSEPLPPIGRPITNAQVFIVDELMKPVPRGTEGEILIGGRGVGRGYRNRPELTAEKFISNTIQPEIGPRLYRTGDRGCYLPDGQIAFKGRIDDQIKIRGVRIEPGEIEAALNEHPRVRESAVVARQSPAGDGRLVAYLSFRSPGDTNARELRDFLGKRLPPAMIPALFVRLDELPLNTSGKIDRRALPVPCESNLLKHGAAIAPRDVLEQRLAEIWEAVLGVQGIGVQQGFFELGGDSLLAVRLVLDVEKEMGFKLPLSALLEVRTIEDLARTIRRQNEKSDWSSMVAVQPLGLRTPLFCVHSHTGDVFYCEFIARGAGTNQPIYGLQSVGVTGKSPHLSVEEMSEHYVTELRKIQPRGPYQLFGFCFGGMVAFDMARRLAESGERVAFLGFYNSPAPGTLRRWPLGQFTYLKRRTRDEWRKLASAGRGEKLTHILRNIRNFRLMIQRSAAIAATEGLVQIGGNERDLERLNLEALNIAAAKRYHPRHIHAGRITLFLSPDVAGVYPTPPAEGWKKFASKELEIVEVIVDKKGWRGTPFVETVGGHIAQLVPESDQRTGAL
jgi:amino acid adenylation domain-containing protein